jgi:hypothetical protein
LLLDSERLEFAFKAHGVSREAQARQFYTDIWELVQQAEKLSDAEIPDAGLRLRRLCQDYFAGMRQWLNIEGDQAENNGICNHARKNRQEAQAWLPKFEKEFIRYALCYLELNRALIRMRARLTPFMQAYGKNIPEALEVNNGTGTLIFRAHAERQELIVKTGRIEKMRDYLRDTDRLMEALGRDLPARLGEETGGRQLVLFKGALRQRKYAEALQIAAGWKKRELMVAGEKAILLFEEKAPHLKTAEGLLVLHSGELGLPLLSLKSDMKKLELFLRKYSVPYMLFQYKNLLRQGYLLGRIGSIEGLIVQHAKLLSLAARPHPDSERAHMQEQMILMPARRLITGRFKTMTAIFREMENTVCLLEKLFEASKNLEMN